MASSGTVTDPVIEARFRPPELHDSIFLMGRVRIKSSAIIEAGDLTLRTIKALVATSVDGPVRPGGPPVAYGSVTVAGSLMNSIRLRSFQGSIRQLNAPAIGTAHIGTAVGGTMQVGFFLLGA